MNKWINVCEELPKNYQGWLICFVDGDVEPCWYYNGRFSLSNDDGEDMLCKPTHWQFLPEAPQ